MGEVGFMKRVILGLLAMSLFAIASFAQSSNVRIAVVKDTNGKPIRNASVILHPVNKDGKQEKGGMSLKTDSEGNTGFDAAPYGKLRIQVIAHGFQTFGNDYEISQPQQEIVIKMKPPADQYSIYGDSKDKTQPPNKQ
jgi:hypothetical protein